MVLVQYDVEVAKNTRSVMLAPFLHCACLSFRAMLDCLISSSILSVDENACYYLATTFWTVIIFGNFSQLDHGIFSSFAETSLLAVFLDLHAHSLRKERNGIRLAESLGLGALVGH